LSWNSNGEGDLAGYLVYRADSAGGSYSSIAASLTQATYTDTGVSVGVTKSDH